MRGIRIAKWLGFGAAAACSVLMMAATVIEKVRGTDAAFRAVYHHPLFIALWAVAVVAGLALLLRRGAARRRMTLLLHLSFVLILVGAMVTHLSGIHGRLQLRTGECASVFEDTDGRERTLPFPIALERFLPESFTSEIVCDGRRATVSVNRVFRHRGYRFGQQAYDPDLRGVTLAVNHDPVGIGITYAGYLLLLLSMAGFFFERESGFRRALRRVVRHSALLAVLLAPQAVSARTAFPDALPVLPDTLAGRFGELYVNYNGRIAPMQTLMRDYCLKAYGKPRLGPCSAEQVVTGWLFYYDWWRSVPFKLKAGEDAAEKEAVQLSVASGRAFKIFPIAFPDSLRSRNPGLPPVVWFHCDDPLPEGLDYALWVFVRRSLDLLHDEVVAENWTEVSRILEKIKAWQVRIAGSELPSPGKLRAERLYNRICRPLPLSMFALSIGLILFVLYGILLVRERGLPQLPRRVAFGVALALFLYVSVVIVLRGVVSGHGPFDGNYSVMMLMAWLGSLAVLVLSRRFPLIQPPGLLLTGFTLLVASLAASQPQITPLPPVLQSPLLGLHVLAMMISYTLLGLVALNGMLGLAMSSVRPAPGAPSPAERLRDVSLLMLYPAVFILAFGTFLGAVWANVSWGSYWSWDPKETWAAVTLLTYAFALHGASLPAFRRPRFFHTYCIVAFLAVLVTYFGVNLFLGGMHSYA